MSVIPAGITRGDVKTAMRRLVWGEPHDFGGSIRFDLAFIGRRFPPKPVLTFAAERMLGRRLGPREFKGGEGTERFRIQEQLGCPPIPKSAVDAPLDGGERSLQPLSWPTGDLVEGRQG